MTKQIKVQTQTVVQQSPWIQKTHLIIKVPLHEIHGFKKGDTVKVTVEKVE